MKNIKISSFIFVLILIFLSINFAGYRFLSNYIKENHDKENQILFYQIKSVTDELVSQLLYEYSEQKSILLQKHQVVREYLKNHELNSSLEEIFQKINADHPRKPYNIYITDKNLTIRNSTYAPDIGFDLSFAEPFFEIHFKAGTVGCSAPVQEKVSKGFMSYTDSYLSKNGDPKAALLQVSYRYSDISNPLQNLQNFIRQYPMIKDLKSYGYIHNDFIYEIALKTTPGETKPSIESLAKAKKKAKKTLEKLAHHNLVQEPYTVHGNHYNLLAMSNHSPINKDMTILYTILLDENELYHTLHNLDILMLIVALLGILAILVIAKIRSKEERLSEQDKFVQSAMHEIKTPLSVITLNNELRAMEYGKDPYTEEIDSALRTLQNSYDTMSFIITKDAIRYPVETLSLKEVLQERVDFFQNIAHSNHRSITLHTSGNIDVKMSRIELVRLIDNNLSNALKYSFERTEITVTLQDRTLTFHNYGNTVTDKERIFEKYVRENNTVGGYGLGLNIVKDIARKYHIIIDLRSNKKEGTTFSYIFPRTKGKNA